jgi:hypothetical protein
MNTRSATAGTLGPTIAAVPAVRRLPPRSTRSPLELGRKRSEAGVDRAGPARSDPGAGDRHPPDLPTWVERRHQQGDEPEKRPR